MANLSFNNFSNSIRIAVASAGYCQIRQSNTNHEATDELTDIPNIPDKIEAMLKPSHLSVP